MAGTALKLRVEGMDCAASATKIETAIKRLPDVSEIDVSFTRQSLSLILEEDRTSRVIIEKRILELGYRPVTAGPEAPASRLEEAHTGWWVSPKGRLAIGTGMLLLAAFLVSLAEPGWSGWVYLAATLVGLLPIARRALAGARSGTPFGIETLMTIATIGAVAIGEAEEAAVVVFLFTVGEVLEGIAANRARSAIKALVDLVPRTALRQRGSDVETIPVSELGVGDVVVVRAGDRIPSDGTVRDGEAEVNEAPVTGKSVPVVKKPGAAV